MDDEQMSRVDRILAGIALIRKYEPHADIAAEHDVLYFGSYATVDQMTAAEQQQMEAWHWHEDSDSCAHFV